MHVLSYSYNVRPLMRICMTVWTHRYNIYLWNDECIIHARRKPPRLNAIKYDVIAFTERILFNLIAC